MKLSGLISAFRLAANDGVSPYFWADADVTQWLNQAVTEAAIRRRMLYESENPAICEISVTAGVASYETHSALFELDYLAFLPPGGRISPVRLVSGEALDRIDPEWRQRVGVPTHAIQSDKGLRLVPRPDADGVLHVEGYRIPLEEMSDPDDAPEINEVHHIHLIDWALHKAFSLPDTETFDPTRAASAEAGFTAYFGPRPDADLRRDAREDAPHCVQGFIP